MGVSAVHPCGLFASALMVLAAVVWISRLPASECDDASAPVERALACLLLNVAAFDIWLLNSSVPTALRLWAWHAAAAGVFTLASSATGLSFRPAVTPRRIGSTLAYLVASLLTAGLATPVIALYTH